jgi:hypothetical protein
VEVAVADVPGDGGEQPELVDLPRVSSTQSASREIGTQTSVATPLAPGRSAMEAQ